MAKSTITVDVLNDFLLKGPLTFVQHKAGNDFTVYQDGKKVEGLRSIVIKASYDDATTHEIEYLTGRTSKDDDNADE